MVYQANFYDGHTLQRDAADVCDLIYQVYQYNCEPDELIKIALGAMMSTDQLVEFYNKIVSCVDDRIVGIDEINPIWKKKGL